MRQTMLSSFGSWEDRTSFHWKDVPADADAVGAALHLLVQALARVGAVQLDPVLAWEGHVGEHVLLVRATIALPGAIASRYHRR